MNSIVRDNIPWEIKLNEGSANTLNISYTNVEGGINEDFGIFTSGDNIVNWGTGNIDEDPLFVDAENGDYSRGPRVVDSNVKDNMRKILDEIQDGTFAKEWITENDEGLPRFKRLREENKIHPIEKIGKELRDMMPWLESTT